MCDETRENPGALPPTGETPTGGGASSQALLADEKPEAAQVSSRLGTVLKILRGISKLRKVYKLFRPKRNRDAARARAALKAKQKLLRVMKKAAGEVVAEAEKQFTEPEETADAIAAEAKKLLTEFEEA